MHSTAIYKYINCSYLGCNSCQATNKHLTFFRFPKIKQKYDIWMQRALPTDLSEPRKMYLCELHFSKIYINQCYNRKMLLPAAVPFAVDENDDNFTVPTNPPVSRTRKNYEIMQGSTPSTTKVNSIDIDKTAKLEKVEEQDPTKEDEYYIVAEEDHPEFLKQFGAQHIDVLIEEPISAKSAKRQKVHQPKDAVSSSSPEKCNHALTKKLPTVRNEPLNPDDQDSDSINSGNVYEFIFKGEEYVQLPKKMYLQERRKLKEKTKLAVQRIRAEEKVKVEQLQNELERYQYLANSIKEQLQNFERKVEISSTLFE